VASQPATSGYSVVGAGSETCNGYNARTEALAAAARQHQPRQRSQSALADAVATPDRAPAAHRREQLRVPTTDGD